jgi:hypothetical protein
MQAVFFVLATGIVAFPIVELFEHWRRSHTRKNRRAA